MLRIPHTPALFTGALLILLALPAATWGADAPDMVSIPAGAFTMGRDDGPADEKPAHAITLAAFRIDRLPVTNRQYAEFLNASGPATPDGMRRYDHDDPDARIHHKIGRASCRERV